MSSREIFNVSSGFMFWLQLELAYQHNLSDFIGMERAFDSELIPTEQLKHSPIYSVRENDDLRVHLMETALFKDKAHNAYTRLYEVAQSLISTGEELPTFNANYENLSKSDVFFNIGVGFLNYLKLKNAEIEVHKEFKHFVDSGDTEQMFIKQKEWGEATTKAIDQYHALLDSAYTELGVKDQSYEFVSNKIKEWMATA